MSKRGRYGFHNRFEMKIVTHTQELSRLKGTVGDEVVLKSTAELLLSFVSHSS